MTALGRVEKFGENEDRGHCEHRKVAAQRWLWECFRCVFWLRTKRTKGAPRRQQRKLPGDLGLSIVRHARQFPPRVYSCTRHAFFLYIFPPPLTRTHTCPLCSSILMLFFFAPKASLGCKISQKLKIKKNEKVLLGNP